MLRPLRIAITSGDADGIGPEVVGKALKKLGPQKTVQFYMWRSKSFPKKDMRRIQSAFRVRSFESWSEALAHIPNSSKELIDICGKSNPALWVEEAATACVYRHLDGLATAPLSKPLIKASGLTDLGHTEILKRVSKTKQAHMVFLGKNFNVFLGTGHLPLKDVSAHLNPEVFDSILKQAKDFVLAFSNFDPSIVKRPIGVLGLNPHAGDTGLIGSEEVEFMAKALETINSDKIKWAGPLVPDVAFTKSNWPKYCLYLAMYHDQGLIPFKTVHGQHGVHLTWGLPFIRTSVDHGTAFDIAGKDKADPTSMYLALKWAIKLAKGLSHESRNF